MAATQFHITRPTGDLQVVLRAGKRRGGRTTAAPARPRPETASPGNRSRA
ncbi:hypothetical protein N8J89_09560 [Crossiella sp. CA-258035]|nr:hypothetical protein [Crossiella sp. CA-258035]WHT21280.1 hypothetical protein N8J89_09560 [Crossiella sp. CA-258035]